MKDEDIHSMLLSRNQNGLSHLLDKYGSLIAYITRNTGLDNDEDISECISDTLFCVWKRVKKFDLTKSSFKTWLVMITRGCAIDYIRKNKKYNSTFSLSRLDETGIKKLHSTCSALDYLLCQDLIELLQKLPPPDNHIFYRRFVLGETISCIADILNMTQDSFYKRIQRGRDKLRKLMEKEGYNYG